jgi:hypothetical protein
MDLELLGAIRGPDLLHATNSLSEMIEVKNILGPKRQFQVRQLRLNYVRRFGALATQGDARVAAIDKVTKIHSLVCYPVSTEIVYIHPANGELIFGSAFDKMGVEEFVKRYIGQNCRIGVVVAYHDGANVHTYESFVSGVVCRPIGTGHGWDVCVRLNDYGKTFTQINDANFQAFISFRRDAYIHLWLTHFVK